MITINDDEMIGYIMRETQDRVITYADVRAILDAEMDYLVKKGIAKREEPEE